ncbi:MAG: nitrate- and nitrite sensing domain-containing protein [Actinomadura sp.]
MAEIEQARVPTRRPRTRPIGLRIAMLLAVPLASLIVLWAIAAVPALNAAVKRAAFAANSDAIGQPSNLAMQGVQMERAAAVAALTAPSDATMRGFAEQRAKTDQVVAAFRKSARSPEVRDRMDDGDARRVHNVSEAFGALDDIRSRIESRSATPLEAVNAYSEVFDNIVRLLTNLVNLDDPGIVRQTNGLLYLYWAQDFMQREDALLTTLSGRRLNAASRAAFAGWAGTREHYVRLGLMGLDGELARMMNALVSSPAYGTFLQMESGVVKRGAPPAPGEWKAAVGELTPLWLGTSQKAGEIMAKDLAEPAAQRVRTRFLLSLGVGLLAVIASVALSLLFARRLAAELRNLQRSAQHLAHERLPDVVARLRRGEDVDVDAEAPRPHVGGTREVALVSEAFDTVQRTAVSTAIGEAELRASINRVFINLSWRSQSLLHRQLRLLDQMERRASSPEELDDLFRLDHLTTRMRRHAEGLVILAGSPTMRAWDHPVPAEDVVRAAIAEVEDYTRVEVAGASSAAVIGAVVADVIHLLAELIENAASFSPPTTEVTVKVETVANGLAVEVVDRGIGLSREERDELNRRLASAVEFDLADTERLGLFVVARLAARHGIEVSLQPSVYGGTTAVVLIPHTLVVLEDEWRLDDGERWPQPVAAAAGGPLRLGRAARTALPALPAARDGGRPAATPPAGSRPHGGGKAADGPAPHPRDGAASDGEADEDETADSEITGRLPRRIRQRHLAPQLRRPRPPASGRAAPGGRAGPAAEHDDDFEEPSPELSRDLMSSLQSGWLRGRDAEDDTATDDPRDEWGES